MAKINSTVRGESFEVKSTDEFDMDSLYCAIETEGSNNHDIITGKALIKALTEAKI